MAEDSISEDRRNLVDSLKGLSVEEIVKILDARGVGLEVAIENTIRDFNMGTIVRNANAFGVRQVHIIGRKQWNKRGAMATDKYLHVNYHQSLDNFFAHAQRSQKLVYAIENNHPEAKLITEIDLPENVIMVFGQEGEGVSPHMLERVDSVIEIPQLGSTRSINVGVASGIAMFEWLRQRR